MMQEGYRSPIPKKFQWRTWAADPEGITGDELMVFVNDELFPSLKELSGTVKERLSISSLKFPERLPWLVYAAFVVEGVSCSACSTSIVAMT
jgi:hypothetical protein